MDPVWLLTLAIFSPVLCGAASLVVPRSVIGLRVALAAAGPILALSLLGSFVSQHGVEAGVVATPWMSTLRLDLQFNPDRLGLFFTFLVSGIGLLIVLYARGYFGPDRDSLFRFYPTLLLFMTAMLGVALSDSFMLMLLFWEMTSISSFLLIGWERDDEHAVKLAMQAFITTGAGGLAMMGGLILMGVHTGHWSFSELRFFGAPSDAVTAAAFVLIFVGAAAKSAQFPLHFWLPGAMAAPTPVSAYLHSATMVKAGVYLVGRLWPILAATLPIWPKLIIPLGAVTMLYGAFIAIQKSDLKKIFAYTTVSQLGLLMCMYGLAAFTYGGHGGHEAHGEHAATAEPNVIWDVTQILNHALYKAPLFILAGAIGHIASRQIGELKGFFYRGKTERIMTVVLLLAAYALAAGPLTVSFTAKEFFFYQIWHGYESTHSLWFFPLIAAGVLTGMFNVAIFIRLARTLLAKDTGNGHDEASHGAHGHASGGHGDHEHETGLWPAFLWIPGAVIVAFQYIGGIVPGAFEAMFGWLEPSKIYFDHFPLTWDAHLGVPLFMSLAAVGLGVGLGFAPVLTKIYNDPFDRTYPGFYVLATQRGGRVFRLIQTGHAGHYIGFVCATMVALFVWSILKPIGFNFSELPAWPSEARFETERAGELFHGVILAALACFASILLPLVRDRASRVLILGTAGFSVTAMYYLYRAPDLALTQISIEIVSLILFLLVLSLLPKEQPPERGHVVPRVTLAVTVGGVMFWLTLTSSVGTTPTMPYLSHEGQPFENLGEFFLRNSHHGVDTEHLHAEQIVGGVVARASHGETEEAHGDGAHNEAAEEEVMLHHGGGGDNVVNVILVDFRGFDTMGEITVLGLAAMGVWTLLRRRRGAPGVELGESGDRGEADPGRGIGDGPDYRRIDIPEPTGGPDPEDSALANMTERMPQT